MASDRKRVIHTAIVGSWQVTGSVSFTLLLLLHGKWQEACHSHCYCSWQVTESVSFTLLLFMASDRKRVIHTAVVVSWQVTESVSFTLLLLVHGKWQEACHSHCYCCFMASDRKSVIHTAIVGSWTMVENIPFLVHIISIWIYVYQLCSSVWSAVSDGKNFNIGHYAQTFRPVCFIPGMFMNVIDFYHFEPLQWPWPCLGNHRVSAKQKLSVSLSCTR